MKTHDEIQKEINKATAANVGLSPFDNDVADILHALNDRIAELEKRLRLVITLSAKLAGDIASELRK